MIIDSMVVAEQVIRLHNGGKMRQGSDAYSLRFVALLVSQVRDQLVRDQLTSATFAGGEPPDMMFTCLPGLEATSDGRRGFLRLDLPSGFLDLPDDKGVRVMPSGGLPGDNPYRRATTGRFHNSGTWAEGKVLWCVEPPKPGGNRGLLVANPSNVEKLALDLYVVVGNSEISGGIPAFIPDGMLPDLIMRVRSQIRLRNIPQDRVEDNKDEFTQPQTT